MNRNLELEKQYLQKWEDTHAAELLEEGELFEQMIHHHPGYFITNHGRVISLHHKQPRILKPYYGGSRNVKQDTNRKYPRVALCIDGKRRNFYIHKLVKEYLSVDQFIVDPAAEIQCHHKNPKASPNKINLPSNLLVTNAAIHWIITLMQRQQDGRWKLPSQEQAEAIMKKLLNLGTGSAIFYEKIDARTGQIIETSALPLHFIKEQEESK